MDAHLPPNPQDEKLATAYDNVVIRECDESEPFIANRYREGLRWRHVLEFLLPANEVRILDVGAGNGAIELAFAANAEFHAFSVEELWNPVAMELHKRAGVAFRRARADAAKLPFPDATFGAVLFLETIEHVRDPESVGREVSRITADGGLILITTPPRLRYALRPDPHFGIRSLVLFPPFLQRRIACRHGFNEPHHYVDRIYTSVTQITDLFPACEVQAILSRSRAPKRWFWDAIVLRRRIRDDQPRM